MSEALAAPGAPTTTPVRLTETSVADAYPHLAELSFEDLNRRRAALIGDRTNFKELSLPELQELSAVATLLRRKAAGPPRDAKPPRAGTKALSVDDLDV